MSTYMYMYACTCVYDCVCVQVWVHVCICVHVYEREKGEGREESGVEKCSYIEYLGKGYEMSFLFTLHFYGLNFLN